MSGSRNALLPPMPPGEYGALPPPSYNALQPGSGGWQPSTWRPGMPATPQTADLSNLPMPSPDQIQAQRAAIQQRLRQYGYPPQDLSDQQVLATMTNLPQGPVQWPDWVQAYFQQHPEAHAAGAARPGVDSPTDSTFEDWNLRSRGMGNALTQISSAYAIPRAALIERYGLGAVEAAGDQWVLDRSTKTWNGQPVAHDIRTDYR